MTHIASDGSNQAPMVATGTPVPGTDAETYTASDGSLQEALPVQGAGGVSEPSGPVEWGDVLNKPETYPPTIGTTATTAKAGNYAPSWSDVTSKPNLIEASQRGVPNGVAPLDASGLVPLEYLNVSGLSFKGAWNPVTNTPTLVNGTGSVGDFYKSSGSGTFNFGNGDHSFVEGDWIIFAAGVWQRIGVHEAVSSVNGKTGMVALNAADVGAKPSSYAPTWAEITGKPDFATAPRGVISPPIPAVYGIKGSDQSIVSGGSGDTVISWAEPDYDQFSVRSGANFVMPSWATHARVTTMVRFAPRTGGYRYVGIFLGTNLVTSNRQLPTAEASVRCEVETTTGIFPVLPGNTINVRAWQSSGSALDVQSQSWVQLELFEALTSGS